VGGGGRIRAAGRVAVIGSGSHFGWATGRRTVDEAVKDALGFCTPHSAARCTVVNINNKPVE
jgi:hypothetical protein